MRIALAQFNPTVGILRKNCARIKELYQKAGEQKADLVVFSQMALSGYPPKDLLLYNDFISKASEIIKNELAPLTAKMSPAMIIGSPFAKEGHLYNSAFVLEEGKIKSVHHKTVLVSSSMFDERRYFTTKKEHEPAFVKNVPLAIAIGEDLYNNSNRLQAAHRGLGPAETLFSKRAQFLINLDASSFCLGANKIKEAFLAEFAARHKKGLIYLNQTGGSDELIFDGKSLAINSFGETIYRAASFAEELFYVESEDFLKPQAKALAPLKEDIDTLYRALKLGLKDYAYKTGFKKVVLGISGGLDSAVVAALAAHALGPENVLGLSMPSAYSPLHSVQDAVKLAENLKMPYRVLPINTLFNTYLELVNQGRDPYFDVAEENLQARIRGNLVMHYANREGLLALTASNKSELAVGYCTLYGDMAGGLAVIADLSKTIVYELAHHINNISAGEQIPLNTINKPPSAELSPGQKDEDSLPPYHILDPILKYYTEEHLSAEEIIEKGYAPETVKEIIYKVGRAEFKRRQAALRLRVTTPFFGLSQMLPLARRHED